MGPHPHRPPAPSSADRRSAHLRRLLAPEAIEVRFEPVVRLTDGACVGYAARPTFPPVPGLGPMPSDVTFAAAGAAGLRGELDAACWTATLAAGAAPRGRFITLDAAAASVGTPALAALAPQLPPRAVISVGGPQADPDGLRAILAGWVREGAMVGVEDSGAGVASLELVSALRPDFVTLPPRLVAGIATDPAAAGLLRALVAFSRDVGARVVAAGVERAEDLEILRAAGVDHGRGPLFGPPAAPWPVPGGRGRPGAVPAGLAPYRLRRDGRLEAELATASTVGEACATVVEHLAGDGLMPSIYLERGGRLRCQAQRGYWQVLDGIPVTAGVMGRTFRTGEAIVIADVTTHEGFLPAVPGVMAEACVPLRARGAVVGVLNVEAAAPLSAPAVEEVGRCASLIERRFEDLGVEDASPAQRLARAAARLATLDDPDTIVSETIRAARAVAGMESAMLALRDRSGRWAVLGATGPFAAHFEALTPAELGHMSAWVELGTSNYTMGEATGRGHAGHERLRRAGAGALVVLPLAAPERLGLLAVADRGTVVLPTEEVELLELLASHAASGLAMAEALERLRHRAASDPLTGLGHHGSFHAALPLAREAARSELAVILVDLDDFKGFNDRLGHLAGDDVLRAVGDVLRTAAGDAGAAYRLGGDEFAVLADVDGEPEALALAERIRVAARGRVGVTFSIGVALALPGEPEPALLARADAAAYAVKRSGRDGVAAAPPARTLAHRA